MINILLDVARQIMMVIQKEKNTKRAQNVNSGWKNNPGNSARHLALSLKRTLIKLIRRRSTHTSEIITIVITVAIIENTRKAVSFLKDSSSSSVGFVASMVFLISA